MNVAVLIATVLIGSVIPVELVFEFRRARSFDAEPNRPKQRMHNSFMKTKELPRERNPFLLTGKRRWRLFRWIWPRSGRDGPNSDVHVDNTVSAYSIAANGALVPVPGSPFAEGFNPVSVAITPLVPFASFFAKLEIANDGFDLNESFTLGANSNGINPATENVTLQIGTFSVMIPAGSFKGTFEGSVFDGAINGVSLRVQIVPLGNNIFSFNAVGAGVDLTGLTNPVTVVLTIGINSGTTTVTARF
jgi:hypothetical protein